MIVIKLQGGLGNQMFQYAFAKILANKNNTEVLVDKSFFLLKRKLGFTPRQFELHIFNNLYREASTKQLELFYKLSFFNKIKKRLHLNYPKIFNEPYFGFNPLALDIKAPAYLTGYFQSSVYFHGFETLVKELFVFPIDALDTFNKELAFKIKAMNCISVHVRRGDYVEDKLTQQFHGSCSEEYYLKAISLLVERCKDFTLVFFSDDSEWVKEQFNDLPYSKLFIDHNKGENSWKDMYLMSLCKHHIIANSSFSWWGAWLNESKEKIVVAPKQWFQSESIDTKTLLPDEWIKL